MRQRVWCQSTHSGDCSECSLPKPRPQELDCPPTRPCDEARFIRFSLGRGGYLNGVRAVEVYAKGVQPCSRTRWDGKWGSCAGAMGGRPGQPFDPATLGQPHHWVTAYGHWTIGGDGQWLAAGPQRNRMDVLHVVGRGDDSGGGTPRALVDRDWETTFDLKPPTDGGNVTFTVDLGEYMAVRSVRVAGGVRGVHEVQMDFLDHKGVFLFECVGFVMAGWMELRAGDCVPSPHFGEAADQVHRAPPWWAVSAHH